MHKRITLHAHWHINAPVTPVFTLLTTFEKWPEYFPRVAESIHIVAREENTLTIAAAVKSFGRTFPVKMSTHILPGKGFISDNESPEFGTSGHEEVLLFQEGNGTRIEYTYQVELHTWWLRIVAKPLIGWFALWYWEKAVIDEIKKRVE